MMAGKRRRRSWLLLLQFVTFRWNPMNHSNVVLMCESIADADEYSNMDAVGKRAEDKLQLLTIAFSYAFVFDFNRWKMNSNTFFSYWQIDLTDAISILWRESHWRERCNFYLKIFSFLRFSFLVFYVFCIWLKSFSSFISITNIFISRFFIEFFFFSFISLFS